MTRVRKLFSLDTLRMRRYSKILKQINRLKETMAALTDEEIPDKTVEFKQRLAAGESLDDILPEAYALVRESAKRILGMFPYDVQVLGALVLHDGNIAEMKTGEGKTLTATMPLYLNALEGRGAMLVTTNDYLAKRDGKEMGALYEFLGLTVGVRGGEKSKKVTIKQKRATYSCDIIYLSGSVLGFDYLIDNLSSSSKDKFMPEFHYAIIDEADEVLLDIAQTPLIISGSPRVQSNLYQMTDSFVSGLGKSAYFYDKERNEVWFTSKGIDEAERYFSIDNLFAPRNEELARHLTLALQARKLHHAGKNYVVDKGKVKLLDKANGRVLDGMRMQGGIHQAIEEKEKVEITAENRSIASTTYQNLFRLFRKLSGMSGTAKSVEDEMIQTYNMPVVQIPTHKPIIREDYPDKIYTSLPEKMVAVISLVKKLHQKGQPILLVTGSVTMSELYSEMLLLEGISHNVLNAQNAAKEAMIIAEAGQRDAVTVATIMAGRGTDIKLGEGVASLGGLAVIGTERLSNERMDLQMRGRSGRQGDPGMSQFFVSLEDDLITNHGDIWLKKYYKKHSAKIEHAHPKQLKSKKFTRLIHQAQETSAASGRTMREMTVLFDESFQVQRNLVYKERDAIIHEYEKTIQEDKLLQKAVNLFVEHEIGDGLSVNRFILDNVSHQETSFPSKRIVESPQKLQRFLMHLIRRRLEYRKSVLGKDYPSFIQIAVLKAIDECWVEEVDYLQQLKLYVSTRSVAQRDPIFEYHKEAYRSYELFRQSIYKKLLKNIMLSETSYNKKGELEIYFE